MYIVSAYLFYLIRNTRKAMLYTYNKKKIYIYYIQSVVVVVVVGAAWFYKFSTLSQCVQASPTTTLVVLLSDCATFAPAVTSLLFSRVSYFFFFFNIIFVFLFVLGFFWHFFFFPCALSTLSYASFYSHTSKLVCTILVLFSFSHLFPCVLGAQESIVSTQPCRSTVST